RGTAGDYRTGEQTAQAIYDQLHGLENRYLTPGGTWLVLMVGAQGGPIPLGFDEHNRPEWTVNMRAELARATANRP
ncbi:MAG: hypothetical protein QOD39_2872, partial [Mycobacterium sp.]|nr:hypothetical protein [Mycobacterium sp.]